MPSVKNLQLSLAALLLLLVALCAPVPVHGAPADLPETSGEELQDTGDFKRYKLRDIADLLLESITRLRDEQFQRDFGEPVGNMTNYDPVRTEMPLISQSDRCRPKNFSAPRCLKRIYAGLRTYEGYLGYLEKENLTTAQLTDIRQWTTSLLKIIKDKVDDTNIQSVSSPPHDEPAWKQRTFTHSILYNLTLFLRDANKAMRHMITKGFDYVRTENKGSKWLS
ncbi:interleukin-6 [Salminus brasiliensis]|uniref:interleukin-6 n=1 Tax=Salminus brasiliensis TaxID=930266 RepID=UPI003B82D515